MNTKLLLASSLSVAALMAAPTLKFTTISTAFNTPIGIDYHEPTNSVLVTANYPSGQPRVLSRINLDGTHTPYSNLAGLTDELKVATVRSGNVGGFVTGETFLGNGVDGQIVKLSPDGNTVLNPWVSLPGNNNGLLRGSLYVDRSGVFGGDLIAVTTTGQVWRVNSAGTPTLLASTGVHLEGVMVVPNNVPKYGPLAGKIIAGAEGQGRLYIIGADGTTSFINPGLAVEDIDLIEANANFFGVNYGTGRILGVEASQFVPYVGEILLTQENPTGSSALFRFYWNGTQLVTEQFGVAPGSPTIGQWEHVTFAYAGIVEIPPTDRVPEPGTWVLFSAGMAGLALLRRRA
ncbi:MAG: PEP-CTERM sorting domain-containing protein [Acidobacteria bacterium]|nr:PEP-CTERM sorting domain-containing protein [Acidobacteriota bacterium]